MQRAQTQSLPDQCAAQLKRGILAGRFSPGERLPPERVLAETLGVTRVTLRSALAKVEAWGLVEVRQGRGYTVRDFRADGGPGLLDGIAALAEQAGHLPEVAAELLRVRRHLALALVERLLERPADLADVHRAVDIFEAQVDAGPEALADADAEILAALLRASGSPVLQLCLNPVRTVLKTVHPLRDAMYRAPRENLVAWRLFVTWLEAPPADPGPILALLEARDRATLAAL